MMNHSGQILGNYRLIRRLGQGGFAEVYLGEHLHLKTQVAIKLLDGKRTSQDIEAFLREAQTIAALKHPHIVRVLDFGFDAGIPFLVMEYIAQGTLRDRHPRGSVLPLSTILSYAKPLAATLDYAHQAKIIHRDVKPENMLYDETQRVLLSDFGVAATAHSTATMHTIESSGTPYYMAPEQFQGKPCPASDQYALAIVVYEWLCGQRPFAGDAFFALGMQHLSTPVPSLIKRNNAITLSVEQVMFQALAKNPKQRFEGVEAFVHALEQASSVPPHHTAQESQRNALPTHLPSINPTHKNSSSLITEARNRNPEVQRDHTRCTDCTHSVFDGDKYCGSCGYHIRPWQLVGFVRHRGQRIQAQLQAGPCCPRCLNTISIHATFCGICGLALASPMQHRAMYVAQD